MTINPVLFSGIVVFLVAILIILVYIINNLLKKVELYEDIIEDQTKYLQNLDTFIEDSDKYCKNFLLPKEKTKKGFRLFAFMRNILFRFI